MSDMEPLDTAVLIHSLRTSIKHMSGVHRNTITSQFCLILTLLSLVIAILYMSGFGNLQILFSLSISGTTLALGILSNMRAKQIFDQMVRTDLQLPPE